MSHPPPGGGATPPANQEGAAKKPPMWFVNKVQLGTGPMCEKGIYARVTVDVFTAQPEQGGKRWISICDIHIRYSAAKSEYWAALPSRSYMAGGEKKWANVVYLFPEQRELYDRWQKQVIADYIAECSRQGVAPGSPGQKGSNGGGQSAPTTAAPAQAPAAAAAPPAGPPAGAPAAAPAAAPVAAAPANAAPAAAAPAAAGAPAEIEEDIPF